MNDNLIKASPKKGSSIKDAKEEIKNAIRAYSIKDKYGKYKIPIDRQRPICLIGPPGIGKTAIMEQISAEMNIGFVSYSMTHHTRQSALGLPSIQEKEFGGKTYRVSEYTMSEIIAEVYNKIEKSGFTEGILFLDEINCVSETLAAPMLQFLQKKEFGGHKVPDGWVIITAGNPPSELFYNKSVREFDVVTLDRIKKIVISEDYDSWAEYAVETNVHRSVITYLSLNSNKHFYVVENKGNEKNVVTARAWTDLSDMIYLYEELNIPVTKALIEQYLQKEEVATAFSNYYELYNEYKSDYQIDSILAGKADEKIKDRARNAELGERTSLVGLLMAGLFNPIKNSYDLRLGIAELASEYRTIASNAMINKTSIKESLADEKKAVALQLEKNLEASSITAEDELKLRYVLSVFEEINKMLDERATGDVSADSKLLNEDWANRKKELIEMDKRTLVCVNNALEFANEVNGNDKNKGKGDIALMLTTELTMNHCMSLFLAKNTSKIFLDNVQNLKVRVRMDLVDDLIKKHKLDQ